MRSWRVWLAAALVLTVGEVRAQQVIATDGLDIERFKPALDSQGLVLTEAGQGETAGDLNLGFYLHYAYRPLVLRDAGGDHLRSLVDDRLAASFILSMGMFDWLTVGVEVPAVLWQEGELFGGDSGGTGLAAAGLGDIRVGVKLTMLRQQQHGVSLAALLPLTLPSGDERSYMGGETISAMPGLALSRTLLDGMLLLAVNLGAWVQQSAGLGALKAGHELYYRFGAQLNLDDWSLSGEGVGGARIESIGSNQPEETPLEWLLAVHYRTPWDLHLTLGGAVGTLSGWGTPHTRAFFGLAWSPRVHDQDGDGLADDQDRCPAQAGPRDNDGCPWQDSDGDGLTDDRDGCPQKPGPVDNRGCPWPDGDQDGLADNADECPQQPGPAANKGCPWGDADGDGLTDNVDACPAEAGPAANKGCPFPDRDGDGVVDVDDDCPDEPGPAANKGCPWGDADGDGLADNVDQCPQQKEDPDGFADDDGCPDADNDKDGIPDADDRCPDEPEVINGFRDDDGCPDKGKVVVIVKKEKIEILQRVLFATGKAIIKRRSYNLLDQVAQTLRAHDEIGKVRIEGHTDAQGGERYNRRLSQRRAEAVRRYLIDKDVAPERLQAKGYGESKPIASNRTAKGRRQNRRVEFTIIEQ